MTRVLLVEDEPEMASLVAANLAAAGFLVDTAGSCDEARHALAVAPYGLVLLDRGLPDGDGLSLLDEIATLHAAPVIVLTALDALGAKVEGLDAGAADYMVKPFFTDELLARMRVALRRPAPQRGEFISCGRLIYDAVRREAVIDGVPLQLKRRELLVLHTLALRAGRVVQREALLESVYGLDDEVQPKSLDGHVSRLRQRLATAGAGVAIEAMRHIGYLLRAA